MRKYIAIRSLSFELPYLCFCSEGSLQLVNEIQFTTRVGIIENYMPSVSCCSVFVVGPIMCYNVDDRLVLNTRIDCSIIRKEKATLLTGKGVIDFGKGRASGDHSFISVLTPRDQTADDRIAVPPT